MSIVDNILKDVKFYKPQSKSEKEHKRQIVNFIEKNKIVLGSKNTKGHLTASAWIVNQDINKVLLHHHVAFNKWIQLGGHTEEKENIKKAAMREAREESGLTSLKLLSDNIFDLDVHSIPARGQKQEHYHYDIRYIFTADDSEKIKKTHESNKIAWIELNEISDYTEGESILRMVRKTEKYFAY